MLLKMEARVSVCSRRRRVTIRSVPFLLILFSAIGACAANHSVRSGFITTSDGVKLHYLRSGAGPAILFVPGWTMPAEIWAPQITYLSHRFTVVALDPRSHGRSGKPVEGHHAERLVRDIKELIDRLKLAPVVLVGWSLGVPQILLYVDQFGTTTVRALVLVDGAIGRERDSDFSSQVWRRLNSLQVNRAQATEAAVRGWFRKPQPEAYIKKMIAASLQTPTNTAVALLANMFWQGDCRTVLAKVDRPVLYAIANPVLSAQGKLLKQQVASARIEVFEGAGHALFVDEADRFNRLLEEFMTSLPH